MVFVQADRGVEGQRPDVHCVCRFGKREFHGFDYGIAGSLSLPPAVSPADVACRLEKRDSVLERPIDREKR
jgi:hypothetical protein